MTTARLTLQVVTWNSAEVIGALLASLRRQRMKDYRLTVIDNASTDRTREVVQQQAPKAALIQNDGNKGFAAGHNQGIRIAETKYIAIVNPDVTFSGTALETLVRVLDENPAIASVGGKLLKSKSQPAIIDSAGIFAKRRRQFLDRGHGEVDRGQYDTPEEVFGISGAFVLIRRDALASIRIGTEYLDEDFFVYKEDIDLAWRLRLAGWKNFYEPRAILYHGRTAQHLPYAKLLLSGRPLSATVRRLSYRNHLLLLIKNDRVRDWFVPLPRVIFYELGKAIYALLREPQTLLGLFQAVRLLPAMLRKRRITIRRAVVSPSRFSRWFT